MPCEFHIDADVGLVLVRYVGEFDGDELLAAIQRLTTDDALRVLPRRVHDSRAVSGPLDHTKVAGLASALGQLLGPMSAEETQNRVAIIASGDAVFGTSRRLHALREMQGAAETGLPQDLGTNQRVVRSFEEAVEWLGLPSDYPDPFPPDVTS